jgi:tetratricopeptide (TPR) repeat protein
MATLDSPDPNILDAEEVNWRIFVYPLVGLMILLLGGLGLYFYLQNERAEHEAAAREAFLQAKTPAAMVQVADQFAGTTHAVLALLAAGNIAFEQKDYATAGKDYQRAIGTSDIDPTLRDSARLGFASSLEAGGQPDIQAISAYLDVARRGKDSPYAPYAYLAAARIYDQQHDQNDERRILTEAADLGGDSSFVKQARAGLEKLNATSSVLPVPAANSPAP